MTNKDLVYVCSPLKAKSERKMRENISKARIYAKTIAERYDCRAVAPHAIFPKFLNDNTSKEREVGLRIGLEILKICKRMYVCGDVISEGMKAEIDFADSLGIEIIYLNSNLCEDKEIV